MERMRQILDASIFWHWIDAVCVWFGRQWKESRVVHGFLHPTGWRSSDSEHSVFFRLWLRLHRWIHAVYTAWNLERFLDESIFLNTFFWCMLVIVSAPFLPTMAVLGITLIAYLSLFLNFARHRRKRLRYSPVNRYLLLFAVAYFLATMLSVDVKSSLLQGMLFICFALFSLVMENTVVTRRELEWMSGAIVISAVVVALIGIGQYVFGVDGAASWVDSNMFSEITVRVYATFQNPNMLAEYLVLVLPFNMALFLTQREKKQRIFWGVCFILLVVCLLMTYSRGGWLAALIAMGLFVLMLYPRLILLAPVALAAMFFVLPDSIISRFTSIGNMADTSTSYRVSIWVGSARMLADYWLSGVGPGTAAFNEIYQHYSLGAAFTQHSHNLYLQLMADGGICTLVLFLVIVVVFCRCICVALHEKKPPRTRVFLIASITSVLGFLAQGLTDYSFYNHRATLMFWAILGLGIAWTRLREEEVDVT